MSTNSVNVSDPSEFLAVPTLMDAFESSAQDATTPSNQKLDEIIKKATTSGEMVERLREYNIEQASGAASVPLPSQPVAASAVPAQMNAFRVVYPWQNVRCELVGVDERDLDRQEMAIRKIYEGK